MLEELTKGQLDLIPPESGQTLAGFRLKRLEVYNWGTFHGQVWAFNLDGKNALLTGDIGSGKSTLVDAVTTLLVPSQRAASAYNKAAGADSKERNLRSYVLGYYKTERSQDSLSARPVALRDYNSYSVILGVFYNSGYNQTITLAQVFHMKEMGGSPARFFAAAERQLSIAHDFSHFGSDVSRLRKRLKMSAVEISDSFPPYAAWFCRRFGIEHQQALELFHQTVSMKSIGNLTEFVRNHMLEPFDVEARREALIHHFDDLNAAHEAVLKAAHQVELLTPLVADCRRHKETLTRSEWLKQCREMLKPYFAELKSALLEKRISLLKQDWQRHDTKITHLSDSLKHKQLEERDIRRNIQENGGDRIEKLASEIELRQLEFARRKQKAGRYGNLITQLKCLPADSAESFERQKAELASTLVTKQDREAQLQNKYTEAALEMRTSKEEHEKLSSEIKSLRSRRSNIPSENVAMRRALCDALKVSEDAIPFAGELLKVRDEQRDWEGASERLLRMFGLSLLVSEPHYSAVAAWVDKTHLYGRLVYFRVRAKLPGDLPDIPRDSLFNKISIKPDSPFYHWLERELAHRFNVICCRSNEQFLRETRAITSSGQIKMPGDRHEKDDRHRIDDRSRYVLGWTNTEKIQALEAEAKQLEAKMQRLSESISATQSELDEVKTCLQACSKLEEYTDYREIDWSSLAVEIADLEQEKKELESSSNLLQELGERLNKVEQEIIDLTGQLEEQKEKRTRTDEKLSNAGSQLEEAQSIISQASSDATDAYRGSLEELRLELLEEHQLTVESCARSEQDMRKGLQDRIDNENRRIRDLDAKIIQAMTEYTRLYPNETKDVDIAIGSAHEFERMLDSLQADDLPRFQARFKELLNENTIREVANFQSQLFRERETIKQRITHINGSLAQIDYNPGRYILLEAHQSLDADVRDFQAELRACTEGSFAGPEDEQYSEEKFLQVKAIIERFRGRDGQTDLDGRWTEKVTDVRNWFVFSASERTREDDSEYEHYSDSGGKSGGQKEKLAYTILAASLAYQFGLEWGASRSRSFRFVVIDEAFGRGSDESARYALSLFEKLNLQLLVVTPMQKIRVIEPFVRAVGFVHNDGGNSSKLRNLTIEEYQAEKARLVG